MKASRILAGMSAAAFAASLMSMVSASAATEIVATDFGSQIYVMGTSNWNWKSEDGKFSDNGTITLTGNAADLWEVSSHPEGKDPDTLIGDAGVQFYLGDAVKDLADNEYTTETIEYTITASGDANFKKEGTIEATLGKKNDEGKRVTTTEISLAGYESDPTVWTALGELTVTATVKDITVVEADPEPEVEYTFPWTEENDRVPTSAWDSDGWDCYVSNEVYKLAPAEKNVQVTIDYKMQDADYHIAKFANANGWGAIYDEHIQEKYDEAVADGDEALAEGLKSKLWMQNSIQGVELKSKFSEDELKKREEEKGEPVLQDDGFFVLFTDGSLTFQISPEAVNEFANGVNDTGYGGSLFQTYGVDITKITIEEATEAPVEEEGFDAFEMWSDLNWNPASNWNTVANGGHGKDAKITKNGNYTVSFGPAYFGDEVDADGNAVVEYGEAPEGKEAIKWAGAGVWCVDIIGLADAVGAGSKGYEKEDGSEVKGEDKKQLAVDAGIEITNCKVLVDGQEFYSIPDDKLLYGDIEANGNIRIEIMNQYGETYDNTSPFYIEEFFNKAANLEGSTVTVTFDIAGIPEEIPEPEPGVHSYELTTEDGETEATVDMKVGETYDFTALLTDDGEPVEGADVVWAEVDQKSESVTALGDIKGTTIKTDEDGISTLSLEAKAVGTGILTATYTDEDGEDYVVTYTVNIAAADSSSTPDSSSNSSSSSSNGGGNSSGAANEDNNPATGAAALGTVGVLLAGAAMAVSKKKH